MMKQFVVMSAAPQGMLTKCMSLDATQFACLFAPSVTPVHGIFLKIITFCSLILDVLMFG